MKAAINNFLDAFKRPASTGARESELIINELQANFDQYQLVVTHSKIDTTLTCLLTSESALARLCVQNSQNSSQQTGRAGTSVSGSFDLDPYSDRADSGEFKCEIFYRVVTRSQRQHRVVVRLPSATCHTTSVNRGISVDFASRRTTTETDYLGFG